MKTLEQLRKEAEMENFGNKFFNSILDKNNMQYFRSGWDEAIRVLTRWHDPKEELPGSGRIVIIKVRYTADGFVDYRIGTTISGKLCIAGRHEDCEILGWRYIHELPDDGEK